MVFYLRLFLLLAVLGWAQQSFAQDSLNNGRAKCRSMALLGKWQLSKTFSMGAYHLVKKEDFNDVIQLKARHKFTEEVLYENNHWILQGQWHLDSRKGTLSFTQRTYILGKPEDHPKDIVLFIIEANTKSLAGKSTDKGQPVELYYYRIR
jgi:hypothetical protein